MELMNSSLSKGNCIPEQDLQRGVLYFSISKVLKPYLPKNLAATDPDIPPPTTTTS